MLNNFVINIEKKKKFIEIDMEGEIFLFVI